eukprot:4869048-Prorocentrum_lima.AAC.1
MTSSLVGSEMCIRDSQWTIGSIRAPDAQDSQPLKAESNMRTVEEIERPVSYTHLTLPTICSV